MEEDKKEWLEDFKNNLAIEQIEELLLSLSAEPIRRGDYIMCRTICHGGDSHKLYYYDNTKLFRCFTHCTEASFDVFQLIMKVYPEYQLPQAINYICSFFHLDNYDNKQDEVEELGDWAVLKRYSKNNSDKEEKRIELKHYDDKILKYLPHPIILPWIKENITREVMEKYGICYNPSSEAIVIPHYDENNILVGIRERTLIKENEEFGKYRPMFLNKKMYNHPLGFNLYNFNNSKENIKNMRKGYCFWGRKKLSIIRFLFWNREWFFCCSVWKCFIKLSDTTFIKCWSNRDYYCFW